MSATIEPWKAPIAAQAPTAIMIASQPGTSCDDATMVICATTTPPTPAT